MTSKPVAGARIKAANAPAPYALSAACTLGTTVSGTSLVDLPGAVITFTTVNANALVIVTGVFDVLCATTGAGVATGNLNLDSVVQAGQATHDQNTLNGRDTVMQVWTATLASAGGHFVKLQGALSATGGSSTFGATHTTLALMVFDW